MKKNLLPLLCVLILCSMCLRAQTPVYEIIMDEPWEESLEINHIGTSDGGMMLVAQGCQMPSVGVDQYYNFVKTDAAGNIQWITKTYPICSASNNVVQASDGGYFICYLDTTAMQSYTILKLDSIGQIVFSEIFTCSNPWNAVQGVPTIMAKNDGGLYVTHGWHDYNTGLANWTVVSLNAVGVIDWAKGFGGDMQSASNCDIDTCQNGDIIISANLGLLNSGVHKMALSRISPAGNLIWINYYTTANSNMSSMCVARVGSDDVMFAGFLSDSTQVGFVTVVIKTNGLGNMIWANVYADTAFPSIPYEMMRVENENVVIRGISQSHVTPYIVGASFIKLDSAGQVISARRYRQGLGMYSFDTLTGGEYTMAGVEGYNSVTFPAGGYFIGTIDRNGIGCEDTALNVTHHPVNILDTALTGEDPIFIVHTITHVSDATTIFSVWNKCSTVVGVSENPAEILHATVYPVPSDDVIIIDASQKISVAEILDINGRIVKVVTVNNSSFDLDIAGFADGIYFLRMQTDENSITEKIVVQH